MTIFTVGSGKDYSTIQAALDALPATLTTPHVIDVYSGTYDEEVIVPLVTTDSINTIMLQQAAGETVTITNTTSADNTITILSAYVTIKGFDHIVGKNDQACIYWSTKRYIGIYDNTFESEGTGCKGVEAIYVRDAIIANNVFNCSKSSAGLATIDLYNASLNYGAQIYNNTFYGAATSSGYTQGIIYAYGTLGNAVKNNVFYNTSSGITNFYAYVNGTFANNLYYAPNASTKYWSDKTNLADWITYSSETNALEGDPLFVSDGTNFQITSSSPAKDAGVDLSLSIPSTDIAGNTRPSGPAWDIGAYEYLYAADPVEVDIPEDTYEEVQTIELTSPTPSADIYYTTDNTVPTTGSTLYSDPIEIVRTTIIRTIAVAPGYAPSPIATYTYTLRELATIYDLIDTGRANIVRRAYIKRRDATTFDFESDWYRVDIDSDTGQSLVMNWGQCEVSIDSSPTSIGQFTVSNLNVQFDNIAAKFTAETNEQSFWYGYSTRQYSQFKITAAYLNYDGTEVGLHTVFEGIINKVTMNTENTANVSVLSQQYVMSRYDISQLQSTTVSGTMTITDLVSAIVTDTTSTDIGKFLTLGTCTQGVSGTALAIDNCEQSSVLSGSCWSVLTRLAKMSASVVYMIGNTIHFKGRTGGPNPVFNFRGQGAELPNILAVNSYDDEGSASCREYWLDESGLTSIEPSGGPLFLLEKYLSQPEQTVLTGINDNGDKQKILDWLLNYWRKPKPIIEFKTKFLINLVQPTDYVTIEILPKNGKGPFNEVSTNMWMITKIQKDIQGMTYTITAEKQI